VHGSGRVEYRVWPNWEKFLLTFLSTLRAATRKNITLHARRATGCTWMAI
jgi:hypothetical protein